jgi:hypothetical protein
MTTMSAANPTPTPLKSAAALSSLLNISDGPMVNSSLRSTFGHTVGFLVHNLDPNNPNGLQYIDVIDFAEKCKARLLTPVTTSEQPTGPAEESSSTFYKVMTTSLYEVTRACICKYETFLVRRKESGEPIPSGTVLDLQRVIEAASDPRVGIDDPKKVVELVRQLSTTLEMARGLPLHETLQLAPCTVGKRLRSDVELARRVCLEDATGVGSFLLRSVLAPHKDSQDEKVLECPVVERALAILSKVLANETYDPKCSMKRSPLRDDSFVWDVLKSYTEAVPANLLAMLAASAESSKHCDLAKTIRTIRYQTERRAGIATDGADEPPSKKTRRLP